MYLRFRLALPFLAMLLGMDVAPVLAARPAPTPLMQPDGSPQPRTAGLHAAAAPACQLGALGPPANAYSYLLPPDDQYFTLLIPNRCPPCQQDGYLITMAHMSLYFPSSSGPCQIPATISIVPAFLTSPGCYTPNPFAPPLYPPVQYLISDGGTFDRCVDYALPVSAAWCITEPVFLLIEFDQGSCVSGRPAFCGPQSCTNCTQYNYYPGASVPGDDLCAVLAGPGLTGNIMFVDATCCSATPTLRGSWGTVKTLYR